MAELQCPFCPKSYKTQRYYDRHMAKKHDDLAEGPEIVTVESGGESEAMPTTIPKAKAPVRPKVPERQEYYCVTPCWHNGVLYKRGRTAWFAGNYPVDLEGNLTHFEPLNPGAPRPVMADPLVTVTPE